ncbi:MAG: orotidine-5'-phosphate decarboxylase [Candidatus Omnitrophota bacterium]
MLKDRVIVALDVGDTKKAKYFVNKLSPCVRIFKIGAQLFTECGPEIIRYILKKKREVFLDLKFFDIPNTVANAVKSAVRLKVKMLTLHIQGADEMLKAAVKAGREEAARLKMKRPLLIGVTVLTSQKAHPGEILQLAKRGISCGLDGVVCSAKEISLLRGKIKNNFLIITPGIRPKDTKADDQKRTATAQEAIKAGADYIVVGRPILEAADPIKAVESLFY